MFCHFNIYFHVVFKKIIKQQLDHMLIYDRSLKGFE